ncbi:hypothetical protein BJ508DRAFT_332405 [Ascobolus immersus RN42]|uniref:Uncharacterized protein n=1 Tax=Ascobolus immersus RN42 TaxID=1160509 RepID=A0A3N4HSX7_ASCIM|nr:hypothetical protein BJ508DRAFT_332405 [Ascobolus immersus RN42]
MANKKSNKGGKKGKKGNKVKGNKANSSTLTGNNVVEKTKEVVEVDSTKVEDVKNAADGSGTAPAGKDSVTTPTGGTSHEKAIKTISQMTTKEAPTAKDDMNELSPEDWTRFFSPEQLAQIRAEIETEIPSEEESKMGSKIRPRQRNRFLEKKVEMERTDRERIEKERIEKERIEKERIEKERIVNEWIDREKEGIDRDRKRIQAAKEALEIYKALHERMVEESQMAHMIPDQEERKYKGNKKTEEAVEAVAGDFGSREGQVSWISIRQPVGVPPLRRLASGRVAPSASLGRYMVIQSTFYTSFLIRSVKEAGSREDVMATSTENALGDSVGVADAGTRGNKMAIEKTGSLQAISAATKTATAKTIETTITTTAL